MVQGEIELAFSHVLDDLLAMSVFLLIVHSTPCAYSLNVNSKWEVSADNRDMFWRVKVR